MNAGHNMSASEIAEIAGVGRAAVSNWRVRHLDFPKPNGGTTRNPTFDRAEVLAWLERRDHHTTRQSTASRASGREATTPRDHIKRDDRASARAVTALLDHVERRRPGAWVVRADITLGAPGHAAALRALDAGGMIETTTVSIAGARRMLVRRRFPRPRPVNAAAAQRRANRALEALGYRVDVQPTPATIRAYTAVPVKFRKRAYRAYLHTCPWTLTLARTNAA